MFACWCPCKCHGQQGDDPCEDVKIKTHFSITLSSAGAKLSRV